MRQPQTGGNRAAEMGLGKGIILHVRRPCCKTHVAITTRSNENHNPRRFRFLDLISPLGIWQCVHTRERRRSNEWVRAYASSWTCVWTRACHVYNQRTAKGHRCTRHTEGGHVNQGKQRHGHGHVYADLNRNVYGKVRVVHVYGEVQVVHPG